jgi:hypothetical protein
MKALKKSLHHTIDHLSEAEARQVLNYAKQLHDDIDTVALMKGLSHDPAFAIPSRATRAYRRVNPVRGKGAPASRLLIKDRQ